MSQTVEVVVISGPRKGEIFELPSEKLDEITEEEANLLDSALDEVIAAVERLTAVYRASNAALKERVAL